MIITKSVVLIMAGIIFNSPFNENKEWEISKMFNQEAAMYTCLRELRVSEEKITRLGGIMSFGSCTLVEKKQTMEETKPSWEGNK